MPELDILSFALVLLGSGSIFASIVVVYFQYRFQKSQILQEKLRAERRQTYFEVLNPIFMIFSKESNKEDALNLIQSPTYRKKVFEFMLIGSDEVVKSYTEMMQFSYHMNTLSEIPDLERSKKILLLVGDLLLKMRKDFGNDKTKLESLDMFRHMISDIDKIHTK